MGPDKIGIARLPKGARVGYKGHSSVPAEWPFLIPPAVDGAGALVGRRALAEDVLAGLSGQMGLYAI